MTEFKKFEESFMKKQVDLIWEVTDQWKYGYQTSYETVKKAYSVEGFNPESRIYAFEGESLVGFVGVNISKDKENNLIGRMRLPLAKDDDLEISSQLMEKIEVFIKSKGVKKIQVPAGIGLGNTIQLAEKFGFERKNELFRRSYANVSDLKVSGHFENIVSYNDELHKETVHDIFKNKMGMPEAQGEGFFQWANSNHLRKIAVNKEKSSWQLFKDGDFKGFSYLMGSDHNPEIANSMPFWFANRSEAEVIFDQMISAHLHHMPGVKKFGNYLMPNLLHLEELYNKFGFKFDPSYMYEKVI